MLFISQAFADIELQLKSKVLVSPVQEQVSAADLLSSHRGLPSDFVEALNEHKFLISLEAKTITATELTRKLRQFVSHWEIRLGTKIHVKTPFKMIIERVSKNYSEETIKEALLESWQKKCTGCRLSIEQLSIPILQSTEVAWSLGSLDKLPKGSFSVPITINSKQTLWVSGLLKNEQLVPVTKRAMTAGERFSDQDTTMEWREISFFVDSAPSEKDMLGKKLRQNLRAGDVILSNMLEREKAVLRGEPVQVIVKQDGWSVTMLATSEQDGFIGDRIRLKNNKSNKEIMATITGRAEAQIHE